MLLTSFLRRGLRRCFGVVAFLGLRTEKCFGEARSKIQAAAEPVAHGRSGSARGGWEREPHWPSQWHTGGDVLGMEHGGLVNKEWANAECGMGGEGRRTKDESGKPKASYVED